MSNNAQHSSESVSDHKDTDTARHRRPRYWLYLLVAVVVIAALLFLGWLPRHSINKKVQARTNQERNALPIVQVVSAEQAAAAEELTLLGTVVPVSTTHVYARSAGYLKSLNVDIGDRVHRGQLLAVIEVPELDATVQQQRSLLQVSKDALSTVRSQLALQQATYNRVHVLFQPGVLSQQDDDVALAGLKTAASGVQAAENNVGSATVGLEHWTVLASYAQVRSPIDEVVTARNVEVGSLISVAGAGQGLTPTGTAMASQMAALPQAVHKGASSFRSPIRISSGRLSAFPSRTRYISRLDRKRTSHSPSCQVNNFTGRSFAPLTLSISRPAPFCWKCGLRIRSTAFALECLRPYNFTSTRQTAAF